MDNTGRRKVAHALEGILKLAGEPGTYLAEARRGGDWTHQQMYKVIHKRAATIAEELVRAGILTRD